MKNNDPIFWPTHDQELSLKQQRDRNYNDSITILQTQWTEADKDQRFTLADQDIWSVVFPGLMTGRRKMFNFNIINPIIQAISGHQRQTRKSSIVIPVISPMQKTADQLTKCLYHIHNKAGAYQVYSDAFEQGALTQGLGFLSIYQSLIDDPISGDIGIRYIDMKACYFDPYFRKHDMSDCRFFETRQFFSKDEAALFYPQFREEILSLPSGHYRDDKYYYMPEVYQLQFPNVIAFDEYWYLASREATYLVDTNSQEVQEFQGNAKDERFRMFMNANKQLKLIKKPKPTIRRAILINDRLIVDEPNPYKLDRYPIVPCLGYFTPDTPYYAYKFRGVTRDMRDAQYLFNMTKVGNLDIINSQQQGLKIKKGALVTPDDAFNQGHGRALFLDSNAQMTDVEPMPIVPPSPVMLQMEEMLMNIAYRIAGVDPSAMGIDVDDKAGIISMMRQAATARNLQRLFDQFDECQRLCGDIMVEMVQKLWTYGKVKQVIGEEPSPEFDNKLFFKYGCKVVQGMLTETQQQLELAQLLQLQQIRPDVVPIDEIIDCMQLQNKERLLEKIQRNEQAAQQQQQKMAELQMKQIEVDNATKLSYAEAERGLAKEREAKIVTDIAVAEDKLKRAHQEDTASMLNLIKALKELQSVDLDHIRKSLEIVKALAPEPESVVATQESP